MCIRSIANTWFIVYFIKPNILQICTSWGYYLEDLVIVTVNVESDCVLLKVSLHVAGGLIVNVPVFF